MPRPQATRCVVADFPSRLFKPAGIPGRDLKTLRLTFDEVEALRLVDAEGLYQDAAARSMGVSRPTLGRILNGARRKTALALSQGFALVLESGNSVVCTGGSSMLIAVPLEGSAIAGHWGHCPEIALYRVPSTGSHPEKVLRTDQGCACKSGLATLLGAEGVTHVLVGQIGSGAYGALKKSGMTVIRGVTGTADHAVQALAGGTLIDRPELCGHEDCLDEPTAPAYDLRKP